MEQQSSFLSDLLYFFSVTGADDAYKLLTFLVPLTLSWFIYKQVKSRRDLRNQAALHSSREAGMGDLPISLHPHIDHNLCLGCGTCVDACPEGNVLGVIREKAYLINPSHCIGHGACKTSCPTGAIILVLGNEKRGIDIPNLNPNFETNVPGLFVAGELGGIGLIRNAIEQGRQAMENIRKTVNASKSELLYDTVIVGAGPAGFSATLCAHQHNLRYVTIEQEDLGGAVAHYPRGKIVMTTPVQLPLVGQFKFSETTKESLIDFLKETEQRTGIKINYREHMDNIDKTNDGFIVKTSQATYETKTVLLAIGRRGTPRKLGVPGEDQTKVVYRLIDSTQYRNKHVLVVGGGNSALEAAATIADEPGATVSLSYRNQAFNKVTQKNSEKVHAAAEAGKLNILFKSTVKQIDDNYVILNLENGELKIKNDAVVICTGGILPTPMLISMGVDIETKHGTL